MDTNVRIYNPYIYLNALSNSDLMAVVMFSVAQQQNTGKRWGKEKQDIQGEGAADEEC